jgi:hypothetical protein
MREQEALVDFILRGSQAPEGAGEGQRLGGALFSTEMLRMLSEARDEG